jgi:hypothetical protein
LISKDNSDDLHDSIYYYYSLSITNIPIIESDPRAFPVHREEEKPAEGQAAGNDENNATQPEVTAPLPDYGG